MTEYAHLCGELREWPDKDRMVSILSAAGMRVTLGRYSIRLDELSHFVFQGYGGDLGNPQIEADCETAELLKQEATRVSKALGAADIPHRFEIYGEGGEILHYLHHDWPLEKNT
jgi:hypothetical protein